MIRFPLLVVLALGGLSVAEAASCTAATVTNIPVACSKCGQILECYVALSESNYLYDTVKAYLLSSDFCKGSKTDCSGGSGQQCNQQQGTVVYGEEFYDLQNAQCPTFGEFKCYGGANNGAAADLSNWNTYDVEVTLCTDETYSLSHDCGSKCDSGDSCPCEYGYGEFCSGCGGPVPPPPPPTQSPVDAPTKSPVDAPTKSPVDAPTKAPTPGTDGGNRHGSGSGDPHFKTWAGEKFDYHGECDLVMVDNPSFGDGLGLKLHIRTTRVGKYFSFIERAALQIGSDVLEFDNDVTNYLINGVKAAPKEGKRKIFLADKYEVVHFKKAISVKLTREHHHAKIDFIQRKIGWPSVKVDGAATNVFEGSVGLLGEWSTGMKVDRHGKEMFIVDGDATDYALEWQVREEEPMLFNSARAPQYPATCLPPTSTLNGRVGSSHMRNEAEKVCAAWGEDKDECIFDVMASRDIKSAEPVTMH